ncbi:MAG TPA: class I SAM-dependent methyltransferase [Acidobacteriaceae bacterium]|nr:class I SAM-dependent methyltransferase [Acidobacteriaceae bacterium]
MAKALSDLTRDWGSPDAVSLYLDRCQVDTPLSLVGRVWSCVSSKREKVGTVLDLGAGDARFAWGAAYEHYTGIEIDPRRGPRAPLPPNADLLHECAFGLSTDPADVCLGNPPYVRNQGLPSGWRERAARLIRDRLGVEVSGLANAWQYFAFWALANTKPDGLVALVIPYEWVSRPSAAALREYVTTNHWGVECYRLLDRTFDHVLTTCSITVIDKRDTTGQWRFFRESPSGALRSMKTPSGRLATVAYQSSRRGSQSHGRAKRGLSPGTQRWLVLTEPARARFGLRIGADVVPCITSLRSLPAETASLTESRFSTLYRNRGAKCWLIRTDRTPSPALQGYLDRVPQKDRDNSTCNAREPWWQFEMPAIPELIVASGFLGSAPKAVVNEAGVVIVGAVTGVYGLSWSEAGRVGRALRRLDLRSRIVEHSNGLRKLEVGQLQALLDKI